MSETGIDSTLMRDVYVVLAEASAGDSGAAAGEKWAVHVYVNPLVGLIWTGGLIILLGLSFSLSDRSGRRQGSAKRVRAAAPA